MAAGAGFLADSLNRASSKLRSQIKTDVADVPDLVFSREVPCVTLDLLL